MRQTVGIVSPQHVHGTEGEANLIGHGNLKIYPDGKEPLKWRRGADGHHIEQHDFFGALVSGNHYNECDSSADSTMTAIMGRMATYSGNVVTWDEVMNSQVDLAPDKYAWDALPRPKVGEDGLYPCALPGITKVV